MSSHSQNVLASRKTPIQARSTVTVEAICEAAIQVLLALGSDRLTTTRVAERAGVSVGTLYQYFPNKQSLLYAVLDQHLSRVADAMESACERHRHQPLRMMVAAVVEAFVDAKMERADISTALYNIASALDGAALVAKIGKRGRAALSSMLATAPDARFEHPEFITQMLYSAMGGAIRAVLEAGATPKMVRALRTHLVLLCHGYLTNAATLRAQIRFASSRATSSS